MQLTKKISKGLGWVSLSTAGSQGLRLLFKLLLAKLLLPEHYGIIGMASVVITLVEVVSELGFTSALIQKRQQHISEVYYHTAFWSNLLISCLGYVMIVVVATPVAAWFYQEPALTNLIPVLGLSVVLNGFYVIPKIQLSRKMDFKPQALIELCASLFAGIIAVGLAYQGYGVWALAFNGILTSLTFVVLYFAKTKWIPAWQFSKEAFWDMFGFGSKVFVERIFSFFTLNIDYILIGKLIGGAALGSYTLAFILTSTFMKQIVNILNKVLYPAYSAIQDDTARISYYYLHLAKLNNLVMAPVMLFFIVLGDAVIQVGFGAEWEQTVAPLRILALAVIISSIGGSSSIVMRSMGRPDLAMRLNILCTSCSTVPLVVIGAVFYGISGAATGILIDRCIRLLLYQHQIRKLTGVGIVELSKQVSGTLLICAIIGTIVYYLDHLFIFSNSVLLWAGSTLIAILYGLYLFSFEKILVCKVWKVTGLQRKLPVSLFSSNG